MACDLLLKRSCTKSKQFAGWKENRHLGRVDQIEFASLGGHAFDIVVAHSLAAGQQP